MRFAFSTLACPDWSIEEAAEAAERLGYDGVELRLLGGEVIDPRADAGAVEDAVRILRAHGREICAFDTSCTLNDPDVPERQSETLLAWIELARRLDVRILRVFGGADRPGTTVEDGNRRVADALTAVAPEAERAGVIVALETHDAFASARRVAAVLAAVASTHVAALWDSHHPYRVGESADDVLRVLDGRIALVHVKDARRLDPAGHSWQLVPLGEGEVPVPDILRLLRGADYSGYVSVEWEKKWHPELADPAIALPQHIEALRRMTAAE